MKKEPGIGLSRRITSLGVSSASVNSRGAKKGLREIYQRLRKAYGPQHWWPAKTPTEVVIGAILTQNTAWTNVERAIENLRSADCLTWTDLRRKTESQLATLIKPSGTYRVKAMRLKTFVGTLWRDHNGSLDAMLDGALDHARARLLAIKGIGPETADAILLYAGNRRSFVVDAYTRRILRRHLIIDADANYESIRKLFHANITPDAQVYNEYHALLVAVGKKHCGVRARCEGCPLAEMPHALPRSQPAVKYGHACAQSAGFC